MKAEVILSTSCSLFLGTPVTVEGFFSFDDAQVQSGVVDEPAITVSHFCLTKLYKILLGEESLHEESLNSTFNRKFTSLTAGNW